MKKPKKPSKTNNKPALTLSAAKKILPIDFQDLQLNPRELRFVAVYCSNGFRGKEACKDSGYSGNAETLRSLAWAMLRRPHIAVAIRRFIDLVIQPYKDRLEYEVLARYYKRATYDIADFYFDDGAIKPLNEIPEDMREIIDGVNIRYYGKEAEKRVVEYSLPNRDTALKMLYQMVTGFTPDETQQKLPSNARERLQQIFEGAGAEITATKTTTFSVTEALKIQNKAERAGPGRPRKTPPKTKPLEIFPVNKPKTEE